jgi:hypothetical protein
MSVKNSAKEAEREEGMDSVRSGQLDFIVVNGLVRVWLDHLAPCPDPDHRLAQRVAAGAVPTGLSLGSSW